MLDCPKPSDSGSHAALLDQSLAEHQQHLRLQQQDESHPQQQQSSGSPGGRQVSLMAGLKGQGPSPLNFGTLKRRQPREEASGDLPSDSFGSLARQQMTATLDRCLMQRQRAAAAGVSGGAGGTLKMPQNPQQHQTAQLNNYCLMG